MTSAQIIELHPGTEKRYVVLPVLLPAYVNVDVENGEIVAFYASDPSLFTTFDDDGTAWLANQDDDWLLDETPSEEQVAAARKILEGDQGGSLLPRLVVDEG